MAIIYTMGEILVEIMRESTNSSLDKPGRFLGPFPSGAPAIFISTVARLGHTGKIWGGVGKDSFGKNILDRLIFDGVDCRDISIVENRATAVAFVSYDSDGSREFIYHIDGTPAADIDFIPGETVTPDYFHVMGCSLMAGEMIQKNINRAVSHYKEQGAKISFDPNIRPELLGKRNLRDITDNVMENCSVFLPGLEELRMFSSGTDPGDCAAELFEKFPAMEIIHLKNGKNGSQIHTRETVITIPVYPIERAYPVIDPTGAGDSFDAAFICALAEGQSLEKAGGYAARAGALNSIAFGPMEGSMKDINREIV